jgi:hypothetical protein
MARRKSAKQLLAKWGRPAAILAAVVVVLIVIWSVAGNDIRVWWTLSDYGEEPISTETALRSYGLSHRPALRRALLRGGRRFPEQFRLSRLMLMEPYYDTAILQEALESEDPLVSRAAAAALLDFRITSPPSAVPNDIFEVLENWTHDLDSPDLNFALQCLSGWRDPRVAKLLAGMVLLRSEDKVSGLVNIGRANGNRETAARLLRHYISDPKVVEALRTVAFRDVESRIVMMHAIKALAAGGYSEDLEIYWNTARSDNVLARQALAADLISVRHSGVIPILTFMTLDVNEVVRRHAVDTLMDKNAGVLLDSLGFLAEDWFSSIRGDLAWAVRHFNRMDLIPYVAWCLTDTDPMVVEKAIVALWVMTKKHHGFGDEEWSKFSWNRPLLAGEVGRGRAQAVRDFMNDEERKAEAVAAFNREYPPAYTDETRIPHLIRQLAHADSRNVRRAMRELVRITGRKQGFPPECLDPKADTQAEANAIYRFMTEERDDVIGEWERWLNPR